MNLHTTVSQLGAHMVGPLKGPVHVGAIFLSVVKSNTAPLPY